MEKEKVLEVKDLEVIYRSGGQIVQAVNGISFSLHKGETLGLVGETGAGKTTTALSILRLLPDRAAQILKGTVEFEGKNLLELGEAELRLIRGEQISMIFQDPMTALNPVMTVGKQIAETIKYHSEKKLSALSLNQRVEEVLEMVGIPAERKDDYPHQFSGGMKQRVVIAIALACEPSVLIADEPTTALDVTIQAQVLAMMNQLHDKLGMAMLLITHDLGIIADMSDYVAVMYAGEIVEYGNVHEIYAKGNHHPYTEGLFQSIPDIKSSVKRLKPIEGLMPDPTDLPAGCKFSTRCPYCMDKCKTEQPEIFVQGSHQIRCHRYAGGEVTQR